tara:strand:+ start:715 stop:1917 length:1203 start_codon:yes stop_codon:yes gene_type:complete
MINFDAFTNRRSGEKAINDFSKHLEQKIGNINSLIWLRNGNFFTFLLNGDQVIRMSRVNYGHADYPNNTENIRILEKSLYNKNKQIETEFNDNGIIHDFLKGVKGSEYIPKYTIISNYLGHNFAIYNFLEGDVLEPSAYISRYKDSLLDSEMLGSELGQFLTLLHSIDTSLLSWKERHKETPVSNLYYRVKSFIEFIECNYGYLKFLSSHFEVLHNKLCKLLEVRLDNNYMFNITKHIYTHNALERGHILVNKKTLSGIIDYEHVLTSCDGWNDVCAIYGEFIAPDPKFHQKLMLEVDVSKKVYGNSYKNRNYYLDSVLYKEISESIWDSFLKSYYSPLTGAQISRFEKSEIEFIGLSLKIFRFLNSMIRHRNDNIITQKINLKRLNVLIVKILPIMELV